MVYTLIRFSTPPHTLYPYYFCFHVVASWQVPKSAAYKNKEAEGEVGLSVEEKKDNSYGDGRAPKLEIKVDGKEEGEEELQSHTTMTWDQPRR